MIQHEQSRRENALSAVERCRSPIDLHECDKTNLDWTLEVHQTDCVNTLMLQVRGQYP